MNTIEIIITSLSFVLGAFVTGCKFWAALKAAKTKEDVQKLAGAALTEALQMLKEKHPHIWNDIKPVIEDKCATASAVENAIREFRGLSSL